LAELDSLARKPFGKMTLLRADWARQTTVPGRMVALWNAGCTRWNPVLVIVVTWAALTVPLVFFRGFNSDEGVAVSIARTTLEEGDWLTPHLFNIRFIERPMLLSWIIAALSAPFGNVSQITARLPIILFLLLGCLLIYLLLRKLAAGVPAALLGVALFLACPLVMRSYVMITSDMPLAVLLFLAFVLWWNGYQKKSISFGRWTAIGIVLALAGLMKGPQPVAYFALGVGLFILGTRSWQQIPGFVLAGVICAFPLAAWYTAVYAAGDEAGWAIFMRFRPATAFPGPITASFKFMGETLPATLLAVAFPISKRVDGKVRVPSKFAAAIACYAFVASIVILFWPGGSAPRYLFPMVLPLCVWGGLAYDSLSARRPLVVAPTLALMAGLLFYALGYAVASPLLPLRFRPTQVEAAQITRLVQAAPGPIYRTGVTALNVLPYVPGRIISVSLDELETIQGPAWIVLPNDDAGRLLVQRSNKLHVAMQLGQSQEWQLLRLEK
jgi:4-amino-4-deoxy-L-arabinose transferase-like glycosyltransferase